MLLPLWLRMFFFSAVAAVLLSWKMATITRTFAADGICACCSGVLCCCDTVAADLTVVITRFFGSGADPFSGTYTLPLVSSSPCPVWSLTTPSGVGDCNLTLTVTCQKLVPGGTNNGVISVFLGSCDYLSSLNASTVSCDPFRFDGHPGIDDGFQIGGADTDCGCGETVPAGFWNGTVSA